MGLEKVGGVEAAKIAFNGAFAFNPMDKIAVNVWVRTDMLAVLKRELSVSTGTITEEYTSFQWDPALADEDFQTHSARTLAAGLTVAVSRSVALFARYTGS